MKPYTVSDIIQILVKKANSYQEYNFLILEVLECNLYKVIDLDTSDVFDYSFKTNKALKHKKVG